MIAALLLVGWLMFNVGFLVGAVLLGGRRG